MSGPIKQSFQPNKNFIMTYTDEQKKQIVVLRKGGAKWDTIGELLGNPGDAVRRWWGRNKLIIDLPPVPKVSKSTIKPAVGLEIKRIIRENPNIGVRKIPGMLEEAGLTGSESTTTPSYVTIWKYIRRNELTKRTLRPGLLLTAKNIICRFQFAEEYLRKDLGFWDQVVWSDETMVRTMPAGKKRKGWFSNSIPLKELPRNPQVQNGGVSCMFWSCFSIYGVGPLVPIKGKLNSQKYKELLETYLLPYLQDIKKKHGVDMIFQQDNATPHIAKSTLKFLRKEKVSVLPWPAKSPDLNPIENLWAIIKRMRDSILGMPTKKEQLVDQMQNLWNELEPTTIEHLCHSLPNRLSECVKQKGKQISC